MKNLNGNDSHRWFTGLVYGTLMACSLATVSIFAAEMVRFTSVGPAEARPTVAAHHPPSTQTNLAASPIQPVKSMNALRSPSLPGNHAPRFSLFTGSPREN